MKVLSVFFLAVCFVLQLKALNKYDIEFAFARKCISKMVLGKPLNGYSNRAKEPSTGILDDVYFSVAVIKDSKNDCQVFVASDTLQISFKFEKKIRRWYAQKYKQRPSSILFNASHTHCSVYMFKINEQIIPLAKEMIETCMNNLQRGYVKFGIDSADIGISRRYPYKGKIIFAPYKKGFYSPQLPIFAFYDKVGTLSGLLWSYACHNTAYGKIYGKNLISADWNGAINNKLKRKYGKNFVPVFLQGAAGEIKPRFIKTVPGREYPSFDYLKSPDKLMEFADKYSRQIVKFIGHGEMKKIPISLGSAIAEIKTPYDINHPAIKKSLDRHKKNMNDRNLSKKQRERAAYNYNYWASTKTRTSSWRIQKIKVNDRLQILAMSGEPTCELAELIKKNFPGQTSIFLGYIRMGSYMASYRQQLSGGYEAKGYGKTAEDIIIKSFKKLKTQ